MPADEDVSWQQTVPNSRYDCQRCPACVQSKDWREAGSRHTHTMSDHDVNASFFSSCDLFDDIVPISSNGWNDSDAMGFHGFWCSTWPQRFGEARMDVQYLFLEPYCVFSFPPGSCLIRLPPEDGSDLEHSLHVCTDGHLLVELGRLCQAGRCAHVVDVKHRCPALAGACQQLGGVDLLEALRQEHLPEQLQSVRARQRDERSMGERKAQSAGMARPRGTLA